MPVLKQKTEDGKTDEWYIHIPNKHGSPPVYTIQVEPEGRDMLLDLQLNHATDPNRAADIEWDLFYALDDLGLLYTYDSDYTPGDAMPNEQTFKHLDDLSAAQRASFAQSLLDRYNLAALCGHDHILKFFLSLQSLPDDPRHEVLAVILAGTPFDVTVIDESNAAFDHYAHYLSEREAEDYNPIVLALIAHFAYEAWDDPDVYNNLVASNEGSPVWVWEDWVAMAGSELMFYSVNSELREAMPDAIEQLAIGTSGSFEGRFYNLLDCEFSALWAAQTVTEMGAHNRQMYSFARAGFQNGTGTHCVILPRPANHDADLPGQAIDEAEETAESERSTKLRRALSERL